MANETKGEMDTESVKSENSSRSKRSRSYRDRNNHRQHSHRSTRSGKSKKNDDMAPFQTTVTINPDNRDGQEVIEVQILPQDDNWGENTTAITGNTSEQSQSTEDVNNWPGEPDTGFGFICQRTVVAHISTKQSEDERNQQDGATAIHNRSPFKSRETLDRRSSQPLSINPQRHTPKRQKSTPVHFDPDADILFGLDDIEGNSQNYEDEMDSDSDDTPNVKHTERYQSRTRSDNKFAKSLPMDIPNFMRAKKDADQDAEDDEPEDEDNVDIAASIKKLAKSVHGGGIFGDLPRPRFSTQL